MKAFWAIAIGILLGMGVAYAYFTMETATFPETFPLDGWPETGKSVEPQPDFMVRGMSKINLGNLLSGQRVTREIFIENVGQAPGEFWLSGAPPESIRLDLPPEDRRTLAPQAAYPLKVELTPTLGSDKRYEKILILQTNQPGNPRLTLQFEGILGLGIAAFPNRLQFSRGQWAERQPQKVTVVSWLESPIQWKPEWTAGSELFAMTTGEVPAELRAEYPSIRQGHSFRLTPQGDLPADFSEAKLRVDPQIPNYPPLEITIEIVD